MNSWRLPTFSLLWKTEPLTISLTLVGAFKLCVCPQYLFSIVYAPPLLHLDQELTHWMSLLILFQRSVWPSNNLKASLFQISFRACKLTFIRGGNIKKWRLSQIIKEIPWVFQAGPSTVGTSCADFLQLLLISAPSPNRQCCCRPGRD